VKQYHDELKAKVQITHDKVIREVESFDEKAGFECSSYKLSREMPGFAQATRQLAYMEGGLR
jgi:molybdopterin biosynthesis enzyme MoaB